MDEAEEIVGESETVTSKAKITVGVTARPRLRGDGGRCGGGV